MNTNWVKSFQFLDSQIHESCIWKTWLLTHNIHNKHKSWRILLITPKSMVTYLTRMHSCILEGVQWDPYSTRLFIHYPPWNVMKTRTQLLASAASQISFDEWKTMLLSLCITSISGPRPLCSWTQGIMKGKWRDGLIDKVMLPTSLLNFYYGKPLVSEHSSEYTCLHICWQLATSTLHLLPRPSCHNFPVIILPNF